MSDDSKISLAKPCLGEAEISAVAEVLRSGWVTQGPTVEKFEQAFARQVNSVHACATSSCTTALHVALLAAGVTPGSAVITASHSFIATANVIRHCGAEPLFVDIDPQDYCLSASKLETFIGRHCVRKESGLYFKDPSQLTGAESPWRSTPPTGRITAILAVHQIGFPCDMPAILGLARQVGVPVIEDAACAMGTEIRIGGNWEPLGLPHGEIACFSFHPRKVLTTGDGGMLTTRNAEYDRRFRLLRQHGMSVSDLARHQAQKIVFEEYETTAFNYRLTDIQAAIGVEQLKRLPELLARRYELDRWYRDRLARLSWLQPAVVKEWARPNWQSYPCRVLDGAPVSRNELMQRLLEVGIATKPGIMNAHQEAPYRTQIFDLVESEKARDSVILLPLHHELTEQQVDRIAGAIERAAKA